jgi:hypothetical protein
MPHDPRKLLHDMLDSCQFAIDFSLNRTFDILKKPFLAQELLAELANLNGDTSNPT